MFLTCFFHAFCYAVGVEKALIQAALRVRFSRGKGFIPFPCPYRRCNAPKSSEKCPLSRNIPYLSNRNCKIALISCAFKRS